MLKNVASLHRREGSRYSLVERDMPFRLLRNTKVSLQESLQTKAKSHLDAKDIIFYVKYGSYISIYSALQRLAA